MPAEPTPVKPEPHDDCCVDSSAPQGPARLCSGRVMSVKDEPETSDEDSERVKEQYKAECGVSEAAMLAGLYMDHRVQGDLVLGPQRLQARDSVFALHAATVKPERPELCECFVRLERLHCRSPGNADHSLASVTEAPILETEANHIEDKGAAMKHERNQNLKECFVRLERLLGEQPVHPNHRIANRDQSLVQVSEETDTETRPVSDYETSSPLMRNCWVRLERCDLLCAATTHGDPEVTSVKSSAEQKTVPRQKQKQHILKNAAKTNKYVCDTCGKTYKKKKWLIRHLHSRKPKKHTCRMCNKEFPYLSNLQRHERLHTGERPYSCTVCQKKFIDLSALNGHTKGHTEKPYSCEICSKEYKWPDSLKMHQRIHLNKMLSCGICHKKFTQQFMLKYHELSHTGARPYHCEICNKSFRKLQHVHIHKRIHTGEKPYSCQICNKKFVYSGNLNAHMKIHKGVKPYSCKTCHRRFIDSSKLKQHQRIHSVTKPYSCNICDKKFGYLLSLKGHLRTHTKEQPYSCEICKKQFSFSQSLYNHKRVHSGEKPYSCKTCEKKFRQSGHLRRHELIHSDKMPFPCVICGKKFRQLHGLKLHKLIHTGEKSHACQICQKKFTQSVHLLSHQRRNHTK